VKSIDVGVELMNLRKFVSLAGEGVADLCDLVSDGLTVLEGDDVDTALVLGGALVFDLGVVHEGLSFGRSEDQSSQTLDVI